MLIQIFFSSDICFIDGSKINDIVGGIDLKHFLCLKDRLDEVSCEIYPVIFHSGFQTKIAGPLSQPLSRAIGDFTLFKHLLQFIEMPYQKSNRNNEREATQIACTALNMGLVRGTS